LCLLCVVILKMSKYKIVLILLFLHGKTAISQVKDSTQKKKAQIIIGTEEKPELTGTRIVSKIDSLLNPELRIGGYISTYYAHYDDEIENNNFVQFPTLAPRKDQFSLNMALISMEYKSQNLRGNIALHYGDIPESSWPQVFNLIQEANAGIRLHKKIWFDAGFFKTHIGLGSFQPRENITSSMSIPDFYDPYFLSGAKLSYLASNKLSLHFCMFNGYNEYIDNNKNKALNFTMIYNANSHLSVTYNFLTCDETPDAVKTKHQRYYQNAFATLIYDKFIVGIDVNFGLQENTAKKDSTKMASMYAGTLSAKYNILKKLAIYGRVEDFQDPDRIFTGNLDIGQYIRGTTAGFEIKPQKNASMNFEWRILEADHLIFRQKNTMLNRRNEFIVCLDLWF
jgi:hypothetical protein